MVCGSPLDYAQQAEQRVCQYCGRAAQGHGICPAGHFVCDTCHGMDAKKLIEEIAFVSEDVDPLALAERMISLPNLPMLGCEHAFIACGALMTSLKNSPYGKNKITNDQIREAFERTAVQGKGGFCALTGVCGIAPAVGACLSIFLGARCGSDSEQRITMEAVIRVMQSIAKLTGPSCCKAYVRTALTEAAAIFSERFGIVLPVQNDSPVCQHSERHPQGCREGKCPYYEKPDRDIFAEARFIPGTLCTS